MFVKYICRPSDQCILKLNLHKYILILFDMAIIVFNILFILNFYSLIRRSKKYLKSITITDTQVEVVIVEKDKELSPLKIDLEDTRIKVFEL